MHQYGTAYHYQSTQPALNFAKTTRHVKPLPLNQSHRHQIAPSHSVIARNAIFPRPNLRPSRQHLMHLSFCLIIYAQPHPADRSRPRLARIRGCHQA